MSEKPTLYVCNLSPVQISQLHDRLDAQGWSFSAAPYAHWKASKDKTSAAAYLSGKVTVQGKGTADLVQFVIEPEILGEARYGYEQELVQVEKPEMFLPHAGIDESGKGDFFGPLVIAAAYVDADSAKRLVAAGVADSKTIKNEKRIMTLDGVIRAETNGAFSVIAIGPESYNRLHTKFGNVNNLLAWGHARALENLLELAPDCPRAISDQFGAKHLVQRALLEKGKKLVLEQMHRAEADVAVAAASILARAEFVRRLDALGKTVGVTLPKGASAAVDAVAAQLAAKGGTQLLANVAKMHFRTLDKALGRLTP